MSANKWGYPDKVTVKLMSRFAIVEALEKAVGYPISTLDPQVGELVEDIEQRLRNWIGHQAADFVERKAIELSHGKEFKRRVHYVNDRQLINIQAELYKIDNPDGVPSGVPDWDYQPVDTFIINGRSGIPATIEVFNNTPTNKTLSAETRSLTRQQIINWVAKQFANFDIDDLWCEDGFWYGQLIRVRY